MKRSLAGYTLLEVLIAAGILTIGVAAAAALALATVTQEEINSRVARCLNLQEQAMRLYQLGVAPGSIAALLPPDPAVVSLSFTTQNLAITGLGTVEQADSTLIFRTTPVSGAWVGGTWSSGESSDTTRRTTTMTAIRPAIR